MMTMKREPQLRFPEFSGEWKESSLSDDFSNIRNGFVGTATPHYVESGVLYLQGTNIKEGKIDATSSIYITEEFHKRNAKSILKENDILVVQSGHVGECAVVHKDFDGCNCHALIIMSPSMNVNSSFYASYINSNYGKKRLNGLITGNTVKHILASDMKKLKFSIPSIPEQQKIADCLTVMDESIESQQQKVEQLKAYKKGLLQQLFSQSIRFPDFEGEWEEKKLGEVGESIIGLTYSKDDVDAEGVLVLRSSNIKDNVLDYSDSVYVKKNIPEKLITKEGDILICTNNGSKNLIGKSAFIDDKNAGHSFGGFMTIFRSENGRFVFQLLQTELFRKEIYKNLGSIINRISIEDLNNMKFHMPLIQEQQNITDCLSALDEVIELENQKLEQLRQYKKGLLQQLFV